MLRRSRLLVPVLVVGAALYWTVALGLGGVSLALVAGGDERALVPESRASIGLEERISVRLVSADEVPTVDGDTEMVEAIRVGLQPESFERDNGPGKTSY